MKKEKTKTARFNIFNLFRNLTIPMPSSGTITEEEAERLIKEPNKINKILTETITDMERNKKQCISHEIMSMLNDMDISIKNKDVILTAIYNNGYFVSNNGDVMKYINGDYIQVSHYNSEFAIINQEESFLDVLHKVLVKMNKFKNSFKQ